MPSNAFCTTNPVLRTHSVHTGILSTWLGKTDRSHFPDMETKAEHFIRGDAALKGTRAGFPTSSRSPTENFLPLEIKSCPSLFRIHLFFLFLRLRDFFFLIHSIPPFFFLSFKCWLLPQISPLVLFFDNAFFLTLTEQRGWLSEQPYNFTMEPYAVIKRSGKGRGFSTQ